MARPAKLYIDTMALLHNIKRVQKIAVGKSIIAMVKANAYGCGLNIVQHALENHVQCFGVACVEEAIQLRQNGSQKPCLLLEGVFSSSELQAVVEFQFDCVIHHQQQLHWFLHHPLLKSVTNPIQVWIKINTGMNRLGFSSQDAVQTIHHLAACPWIKKPIGIMMHFASADVHENPCNQQQWHQFLQLKSQLKPHHLMFSAANSAAILSLPDSHLDWVRPGLMLYGASPFPNTIGADQGLKPVLHLTSQIIAIHRIPTGACVGYGGTWQATRPSVIGVVAMGYADGYPRHLHTAPPVWVKNSIVPVVGRVSMDMLTIDLTDQPDVTLNDEVELWGKHIPIEHVAQAAGTIAYELMCHVADRCRTA